MLISFFLLSFLIPLLSALSIPSAPSIFQLLHPNISSTTPPPNITTFAWPPPPYIHPYHSNLYALKFLTYGAPAPSARQPQIVAALDSIIYRILKGAPSYERHTRIAELGPLVTVRVMFFQKVSSVKLALVMQTVRGLMDTGYGPREIKSAEFAVREPWVVEGRFEVGFREGWK